MEPINARFDIDWPGFNLTVDLELPGRGVTGLFGHSGSGKTTLLRCIAGLVRAPKGRLVFRGEVWQDENTWVPTHRRSLGYVFQEASLFPHLTVMGNLRYGQKRAPAHGRDRGSGQSRAGDRAPGDRSPARRASRIASPAASASGSPSPAPWRSARGCC